MSKNSKIIIGLLAIVVLAILAVFFGSGQNLQGQFAGSPIISPTTVSPIRMRNQIAPEITITMNDLADTDFFYGEPEHIFMSFDITSTAIREIFFMDGIWAYATSSTSSLYDTVDASSNFYNWTIIEGTNTVAGPNEFTGTNVLFDTVDFTSDTITIMPGTTTYNVYALPLISPTPVDPEAHTILPQLNIANISITNDTGLDVSSYLTNTTLLLNAELQGIQY